MLTSWLKPALRTGLENLHGVNSTPINLRVYNPPQCLVLMVQVKIDLVSRTSLAAGSQAVKNFPAVLQALSARPLKMTRLSESLIADLADAVPAVTSANAAEAAELLDLKVN